MPVIKRNIVFTILIMCSTNLFAGAISPIPEEGGFSGRISVGARWMRTETNMFARNSFGEFSSNWLDSINDEPDSEKDTMPMFGGELLYTFADTRMQAFLGGTAIDRFRFDLCQAVGIRKQYDELGIFEGAFLFNVSSPEVWQDPYLTGAKREETDRTSNGGRFIWSRIYNSNFHFSYTYRDIDIEHEFSGVGLGLSAAQRSLLSREGDHHQADLLYVHQLCENQWIAPTFRYDHYGLDGGAMRNDIYSLMLTHTFATHKWRLISNLIYGLSNYDDRNPIYQKTAKSDRYGASTTLLIPNFFNVKSLTGTLTVGYLLEDSNIDFYDTEVMTIAAGTTYTF